MKKTIVGSFPYSPGNNPYQRMITGAMEEAGLDVIRIPPKKWFPLQTAFSVDCDLLHLDWPHDWYQGRNPATRLLKRTMYLRALKHKSRSIGKTKLIWTAHNLVGHDSENNDYERRMIQKLIDKCDGIMVLSESSREQLVHSYRVPNSTSVKTFYHGHYIDCYPNDIAPKLAREKLGVSADEQVFLSLGTIRPYKGHLNLIASFGKIANRNQRLIIAGGSSTREHLNAIKNEADRVASQYRCKIDTYLSSVPDDMLQIFYGAADFCVLPFKNITNSGTLLMAMSFGVPVLAPRIGSIPEVAFPEHSVLYDPRLEDGLQQGLTDVSRRQFSRLDRSSYIKQTKQRYCWTTVGKHLASWYETLVDPI